MVQQSMDLRRTLPSSAKPIDDRYLMTESLAAPLIEATRRRHEEQLARKEAEVAGREAAIRDQQAQIAAARESIDAHRGS